MKRILLAVSLVGLAALVVLSFFKLAGPGGRWLYNILLLIGGRTSFLIPLFLVGIAAILLAKEWEKQFWIIILGIVLMEAGLSGLLSIQYFQDLQGPLSNYGGWMGYILVWPVFHFFGLWVSLLCFLFIVMAGLLACSYPLYSWQKSLSTEKEKDKSQSKKEKVFKEHIHSKIIKTDVVLKELIPKIHIPSFHSEEQKESSEESKNRLQKGDYVFPSINLLDPDQGKPKTGNIQKNSSIIKETLSDFGVPIKMTEVSVGPTVTQYAFRPSEGIKLSKITALSRNIALALAAHPIRIEAPIPGKSLVGIEVPNENRMVVHLRNLFGDPQFSNSNAELEICLGRNVRGDIVLEDLAKMPHLLVAGATGAGKTVFLNDLIVSLLYRNTPQQMRFILIDPKQVEFSIYKHIPHLLAPVISDAQETAVALEWLVEEMERRFHKIAKFNVRDIGFFNKLARAKSDLEEMPLLVVVIDELADLMAIKGREIEAFIVRLAQKARAVGIHLVLATQRPSVEVITGLIKANISCRISFQVASQVDSRTILDASGSEKLLGQGDMLYLTPRHAKPIRVQAPFVSEKEVGRIVDFIREHNAPRGISKLEESLLQNMEQAQNVPLGTSLSHDPFYEKAKAVVIADNRASASLLQRRLAIGYARAARLLDTLEAEGIVGPSRGSKPREIIYNHQEKDNDQESEENF